MDYFGLDEDIASLESQIQDPQGRRDAGLLTRLAWYLRRRDSRRAMRLADDAQALLAAPDALGEAPVHAPRLALVRAECSWLFGNLSSAEVRLGHARQGFEKAGDFVGLGDCALTAASVCNEMGRTQQRSEALEAARAAFSACGDALRLQLTESRAANLDAYEDAQGARQRWASMLAEGTRHAHPGVRGAAYTAQGSLAFQSDAVAAVRNYQAAYECSLAAGDLHSACLQATNAGAALLNMHITDLALEWMERAHEIARPTGWLRMLAWCKVQMAVVLIELGRHEHARVLLQEGRSALATFPSRHHAHACWYLGQLYLDTGAHVEALDLLVETERLGHQLSQNDMVAHGLRGQALALSRAGRADEARATAERGLELARATRNAWHETLILEALGKICREHRLPAPPGTKAPSAPIHYLELALAAAERTGGYSVKPEMHADLSRDYEAVGDWPQALQSERRATQTREAAHAKRATDMAIAMQMRHERERARIEAAHRRAMALDGNSEPAARATAPAPLVDAPAPPAQDIDSLLARAHSALDAGQAALARALGQQALDAAETRGDRHAQARVLTFLAYHGRVVSRLRSAHETGRRAAQIFQLIGDIPGESSAMATVSLAASSLGRDEEAVEAGLLSVQLAESLPRGRHLVVAYNYLGAAYCWARYFDKAAQAYDKAAEVAELCTPPVNPAQPRLNRVLCEAIRVLVIRCRTGQAPPLDRLDAAVDACSPWFDQAEVAGIVPGFQVTARSAWHLARGLGECWNGRLAQAQADADAAHGWLERYGLTTWLDSMESWLRAEMALMRGEFPLAETHAARMVEVAVQMEHEQLAGLGRLLVSEVLERQGKHDGALRQLRELLDAEHKVRIEGLEGRGDVVRWQLDMRNHKALAELETRRAEALEAVNDTLRTLGTIGHEITATIDPSAVFTALHRRVGDLLDAPMFSVFVLEGDQLVLRFGIEDGHSLPPLSIALDDPRSQAVRCVRERRVLSLEWPRPPHPEPELIPGTRPMPSALFAPLMAGERVLGALSIQSDRENAYGERERQIFRMLTAYGAVALANALGAQDLATAQAELERQKMRSMLVHAGKLASVGRLASGIVHELSHPVGAISLSLDSLQTLLKTGQSHEAQALVPEIAHEVTRLRSLILRLRHMARSDPPRIARHALRSVIDDARQMFGPRIAKAGVIYEESVGSIAVSADAELLGLAIANLVANAVDALERSMLKRISLRAWTADPGWVYLAITDTGPGLSPQALQNLFQPFYTTKPEDQGLGLGLALCAEYLAAMGARIEGRNTPQGGAEFRLAIPSG